MVTSCSRNAAGRILRGARRLRTAAVLAASLTASGCAAATATEPRTSTQPDISTVPNELSGSFETVTFGDLSSRQRALRAFTTESGSLRLKMVRTTVEGDPITYYLIVEGRSVRLLVDWRQDRFGGGRAITDERFTDLWLIRMNTGDQEPTRVDPDTALPPGVYALRGLVCAAPASCLRDF